MAPIDKTLDEMTEEKKAPFVVDDSFTSQIIASVNMVAQAMIGEAEAKRLTKYVDALVLLEGLAQRTGYDEKINTARVDVANVIARLAARIRQIEQGIDEEALLDDEDEPRGDA